MLKLIASCSACMRTLLGLTALVLGSAGLAHAQDRTPPIVHKIQTTEERIEMTANTSRILELEKKIPRGQVNNPEVLDLKPIMRNQVQIHALKPGSTQVNLWDDANQIHAIDIVVYADVKELSNLLKSQFPKASVMVVPTSNSVILKGFADQPETVQKIVEISQDYYPRVINNIVIGQIQKQQSKSENKPRILIPPGLGNISLSEYVKLHETAESIQQKSSSK